MSKKIRHIPARIAAFFDTPWLETIHDDQDWRKLIRAYDRLVKIHGADPEYVLPKPFSIRMDRKTQVALFGLSCRAARDYGKFKIFMDSSPYTTRIPEPHDSIREEVLEEMGKTLASYAEWRMKTEAEAKTEKGFCAKNALGIPWQKPYIKAHLRGGKAAEKARKKASKNSTLKF